MASRKPGTSQSSRVRKRLNGEGSIRRRSNGLLEARLMVGRKPDGSVDRRSVYGRTIAEVQRKFNELQRQAQDGTLPRADGTTLTLEEYVQKWLPYHEQFGNGGLGCRRNTMSNYHHLWKHLGPLLGKKKLASITPNDLKWAYAQAMKRVQEKTKGRKDGRRTAELCHTFMHVIMESALREGLIARNPCKMLKDRPKTSVKQRPVITMEQAQQVLDAVKDEFFYPAFLILMATGARRNEVLGLQWKDIDLLQGKVSINKQVIFSPGGKWELVPPKTDAGIREVPLDEAIVDALLAYKNKVNPAEDDFVCSARKGRPLRPETLNHRWIEVRTQLGLPQDMHLHDLRHSFITWHAEFGTNPKAVAQIVGHADERTTMHIYQAVTSKMVQDAARVAARLVPSNRTGG